MPRVLREIAHVVQVGVTVLLAELGDGQSGYSQRVLLYLQRCSTTEPTTKVDAFFTQELHETTRRSQQRRAVWIQCMVPPPFAFVAVTVHGTKIISKEELLD